ncbi:MAG: toll/interleukin-1 receptor domain-containing protein [Bacteroidia bacterium]|nr:toll/interleukin-1 receptor domain-containing protein [Bacteroidia bacterium]MBT8267701.1 toll/interleukin-1 receptor domain-containing protein [Bacteroidia bacterium]NNF81608.1 toll/interleukin-1 receptor domain-containing protein [Flavobacteriaceae bacterium]NNK71229.1 toll/interleukin-1 receptor domain-containing protein [Flavobacteriaceae bacterium]NNL78951.1 toll/interleukin-1 receptor domain-containing protein [Flavobacteriaceae bacterium]
MPTDVIFVSYSRKDKAFAEAIADEFEKLGAKVWIDREINLGKAWDNEIDEALGEATHMVLIMSTPAAISENVRDEVSEARELGKEMVPILIEQIDPEHVPFRWKRMQYADFLGDPERAMKKVLTHFGYDSGAVKRFVKLRDLIRGIPKTSNGKIVPLEDSDMNEREQKLMDELISEEEIDAATEMHHRGRKKEFQVIALVLIGILLLFIMVKFILKIPLDSENMVNVIATAVACALCLGLIVKPIGKVRKHTRNIELLRLFKVKRARLVNIIDKMSDDEINNTNEEFDTLIVI